MNKQKTSILIINIALMATVFSLIRFAPPESLGQVVFYLALAAVPGIAIVGRMWS